MSNFRTIDRETGFLLPPSVAEWLPEKHLARFVVEVVDGLDLRAMSGSYRGSGSASYHRACCWAFWFTATRRACFRAASWSVRLTTWWRSGSSRPTIIPTTNDRGIQAALSRGDRSSIRSSAAAGARDGLGTVALDGTKIHANASRHSALSYEHAGKIEAQLKAEVADLMAKAEAADAADIPDGMSIPDELARRGPRNAMRANRRSTKPSSRRGRRRPRRAGKSPAAGLPSLRSRGRVPMTRST